MNEERREEGKEGEENSKKREKIGDAKTNEKVSATARLMTIEEASFFLNLKVSKLRSMVFKNDIPFFKIGRLVRFHAQDLEEWLLERRHAQSRFRRSLHGTKLGSLFEIDTRFNKGSFERN